MKKQLKKLFLSGKTHADHTKTNLSSTYGMLVSYDRKKQVNRLPVGRYPRNGK